MTEKINLDSLESQINSRQLSECVPQTTRTEQQERVLEDTWQTLTDIYGGSLVSQYGTVMPSAWIALLRGITPRQIKNGLNGLSGRGTTFPPNGAEFRNLCLGVIINKDGHDVTHNHKSTAYLAFDDPKHPQYEHYNAQKRLPDEKATTKRRLAGNAALVALKGVL